MTKQQTRTHDSLGRFYNSMSETAKTAADVAARPTPHNAAVLKSSLLRAIHSVDALSAALASTSEG